MSLPLDAKKSLKVPTLYSWILSSYSLTGSLLVGASLSTAFSLTSFGLVLNMLAEATTTEISKEKKPKSFSANKKIAKQGGTIAGNTREEIEEKTGKSVISRLNAKELGQNLEDENGELSE